MIQTICVLLLYSFDLDRRGTPRRFMYSYYKLNAVLSDLKDNILIVFVSIFRFYLSIYAVGLYIQIY